MEDSVNVVEAIKDSRKRIDALLTAVKPLAKDGREYALAYTALQLGFMRLGKVLGEFKEPNPYPDSMNFKNTKIEPPADKADYMVELDKGGEVENVKFIRLNIDAEAEILKPLLLQDGRLSGPVYKMFHSLEIAIDSFSDAKMWYGQVLNNIREEKNKKEESEAISNNNV